MPEIGDQKLPVPLAAATPDVPGDLLLIAQRSALMTGAGVASVPDGAGRTALVSDADVFDGCVVMQKDIGELTWFDGAQFRHLGNNKFIMSRAATQSIANTTQTVIDFDTVIVNDSVATLSGFTESAGTVTCVAAGTYRIEYRVEYTNNSSGTRGLRLSKNGTSIQENISSGVAASIRSSLNDVAIISLAATDTLTVSAYQSSGGSLTVVNALIAITRIA